MTWEFYGATMQAQHSINELLSLPASGREQDWEFELADPSRIEEMLGAMSSGARSYDEKCALALLMIASAEEAVETGQVDPDLVERARVVFKQDADVREAMLFYWIENGRASRGEFVRDILNA